MQQHLSIKRLAVVVGNDQTGGQALAAESDAVDEVEGVGPLALRGAIEAGRAKAKIELHREIGGCRRGRSGLGSRLAQELPSRGASEAMLGELGSLFVVWGGTEDLSYLFPNQSQSAFYCSFQQFPERRENANRT